MSKVVLSDQTGLSHVRPPDLAALGRWLHCRQLVQCVDNTLDQGEAGCFRQVTVLNGGPYIDKFNCTSQPQSTIKSSVTRKTVLLQRHFDVPLTGCMLEILKGSGRLWAQHSERIEKNAECVTMQALGRQCRTGSVYHT